jgi:hypothetical protein
MPPDTALIPSFGTMCIAAVMAAVYLAEVDLKGEGLLTTIRRMRDASRISLNIAR